MNFFPTGATSVLNKCARKKKKWLIIIIEGSTEIYLRKAIFGEHMYFWKNEGVKKGGKVWSFSIPETVELL